ncbi:MAG: hypothetical protein KAT04_11460 [Methylococcales bacterium]|nr:hypothetical protein [Methylococcales bacterium]
MSEEEKTSTIYFEKKARQIDSNELLDIDGEFILPGKYIFIETIVIKKVNEN